MGDLIIGLDSSAIGTLVERTTRFTMLLHLPPMPGHGGPRAEARIKIATWITGFYNARRLHSVCDFKSPIDYEREYRAGLTVRPAA